MVLGEQGIIDQGHWQDLKVKAAPVAKLSTDHQMKENAILSASFDRLGAQLQTKDETEKDLARQSGDPALYRKNSLLMSDRGLKGVQFII